MADRLISVGDDLTLPPSVKVPSAQVTGLTAALAGKASLDAAGVVPLEQLPEGIGGGGTTPDLRAVALTANRVEDPATWPADQIVNVVYVQDGTGGRTVTFPSSIVMASGASWDLSTIAGSESVAVFRNSAAAGWICEGCWASYVPADVLTPGVLSASAVTTSGVTLTVVGAAAGHGLHASPHAFSIDNGAIWSAWQSSDTYAASGLTGGTAYQCAHKIRNAEGTEAAGAPITVSTIGTLSAEILALSPAGYWKLDETTGTQATDSSGNSRHGTYSGNYTLAAQNGFVSLTNGAVTIPDADVWSVAGSGSTVFALYRPAGASGTPRTIISKIDTGAVEWNLQHRASSTVAHSTVFGSTGSNYMDDREVTGTLTENVWHAIAVARPLPAAGASMIHYSGSGTPVPTTTASPGGSLPANGPAPVRIGNRGDVSTSPMVGALGHVAIIKTKLTNTQVGRLMAAARAQGFIP